MTDNSAVSAVDHFMPLPDGAPDWAVVLNSNLGHVAGAVDQIQATHATILAVVDELKPEVLPLINGLQRNPMVKMLLGGK